VGARASSTMCDVCVLVVEEDTLLRIEVNGHKETMIACGDGWD
jgi:hypothetical protein